MYYDSHTHLNADKLFASRHDYYTSFIDTTGQGIVTVGMDPIHNLRAIQIAQQTQKNKVPVHITLGVHPYEIGHGTIQRRQDVDSQIQLIQQQYEEHKQYIVAIGEGGIDAHYDNREANKELQIYTFKQQCLLARQLGLPIVIHSRSEFDVTYDIIKEFVDLDVYFHCRGYTPQELQKLHETIPRLWVGFCGNLTYPKAQPLRDSLTTARQLKNQGVHILFETDAPYLAPQQKRGSQNEPLYVQYIYQFAAEHLQVDLLSLQTEVKKSFHKLYKV